MMLDNPFELVVFSLLGGATCAILLVTMANVMGMVPNDDEEDE